MSKFILILLCCFSIPIVLIGQVEICDNGIDDDLDGLTDINDKEDCSCIVVEPISVIPNPSFEDMNCCPSERSQLNCASQWIQASEATTDLIHTCDWLGWDDFPPPRPFPDGEGIMGFRDGRVRGNNEAEPLWKEYAGACLLSSLQANEPYRFQFDVGFVNRERSPPIDITFFGTSDCSNLPFGIGNDAFGCPTNSPDWVKLGEVRVSGGEGNTWVNTFIEIVPEQDINAIAIGPACRGVETPVSLYYFFDNLLLADIESFNLQIKESLHPCNSDYTLSIPNNPDFEYQWYKEGVALQGEVRAALRQNYGEGMYQVRILDGSTCRISSAFDYIIPTFSTVPRIAICQDDFYEFGGRQLREPGIYLDTVKNEDNCDVYVALHLEVIGAQYDTIAVSILEGESYDVAGQSLRAEGGYPITFVSSLGCDSLVLFELSHFNIYIPNVFSPNDDGVNDVFHLSAPPGEVSSINMQIFNRWGNLVSEGSEWEARDQPPGVYVYMADVRFALGNSKVFSGTVTLLK